MDNQEVRRMLAQPTASDYANRAAEVLDSVNTDELDEYGKVVYGLALGVVAVAAGTKWTDQLSSITNILDHWSQRG
ncbi:hypothetical protein [Candidatus Protofrankia californiensis]|uniref:hypothetical protein n=1 Tax=Candidatus Protofrankia californiensis TaxID=1839754 RepID=UPI001040EFA5|nr:hypothetical protein [Candidatus Protofrankia californiensis]